MPSFRRTFCACGGRYGIYCFTGELTSATTFIRGFYLTQFPVVANHEGNEWLWKLSNARSSNVIFFEIWQGFIVLPWGVMLTPQISVSLIPRVFLCLSVDMWLLDIVPVDELMPQISAYSLCPKYPCSLCPKYPHIAYVQNILAVASRNRTSIQNIRISSAGNIRMIDA